MRKLLLILFLGFFFLGCSQKEHNAVAKIQNKTYDINQYIFPEESKNITQENYANKVFENIKHYDKEPIYYFRINKQNCLIEVYINEINDYGDFELSNTITPIKISHILKSGKQEVTVKMYPVGNLINEDLGRENAPPSTTLSENAEVEIEVIMMDNKSKKRFDDEKSITKHISPKEAAGKEYYEFSFTFNADVPYEFEGWTKGQDLRKLDQDLVRKKAVEFYKMVGNIYINKDIDALLKVNYPSDSRIMSTFFVDKSYLEELVEEYDSKIKRDYTIKPFGNYTIEFMGDGKLLRLVTDHQHPGLRGGGALLLDYGTGGIFQPGITLYLPEGRDLATQGFMMWK